MKVLTGICPDSECQKQLFFSAELNAAIECTNCGQRHERKHLLNIEEVSNVGHALQGLLHNILIDGIPDHVKKSSDFVKVKGLSNYGCKLLSPLLTRYGLHKDSQEVRLLRDMGQGDTFDCSHLADRAFLIEEQNLLIPGYGKDTAADYLKNTLAEIAAVNNNEELLVPIHADGDGHCLLHAISRALVGHELFWHSLLTNLKLHFIERQDDYKCLFKEFIEVSEWKDIIEECEPNFVPSYGETHGLRNIHIFGLANVLHRPIILIDSLEGMKSKGDYSAVFLPGLIPIEKCQNRHSELHKPIVISWSSKGRNHFVPLVGIQGKALPKFPSHLLPKVWGLPQDLLTNYIKFENNLCVIGGNNSLQERYLMKLTAAMEKHFCSVNGVSPAVVTDVYHHIFRPSGVVGISTEVVTEAAQLMVKEGRLFKCLRCQSVAEEKLSFPMNWLEPGGELYEIAIQTHGTLKDGHKYRFPAQEVVCSYKQDENKLLLVKDVSSLQCQHCKGPLRQVKNDGSLIYLNGDQLSKPASSTSKCGCGYKHFWEGKEYDNLPEKIPVDLEWNNVTINELVYWFQNESDTSLNSNVYKVADELVQTYFPGEFGSETIVRKVVDQIFAHTTKGSLVSPSISDTDNGYPSCVPTKIILTGEKTKTLHKEELTVSKSEQIVQRRIDHSASFKQKRLSSSPLKPEATSPVNTNGTNSKSDPMVISTTREKIKKEELSKKIRIVCEDQGHKMFLLTDQTNFSDIQRFIHENFDVKPELQDIKYGFPPRKLEAELDADGQQKPLSLKHGDRIIVHRKKLPPKDVPLEISSLKSENTENLDPEIKVSAVMNDLTSSLFTLFDDMDLWQWACTQRSLFQVNGYFYKMAYKDLGLLTDDQHLSLPYFPGKIFVYKECDDEILLCLGEDHIAVQPLTLQELQLAAEQAQKKKNEISTIENMRYTDSIKNFLVETNGGEGNHFPGAGRIMQAEGDSNVSIASFDDIPTIRETIDFAEFKIEKQYKREEQMETSNSPLNGNQQNENEQNENEQKENE